MTERENTLDILYALSNLLSTGLDREALGLCVNLCENNVNPEALAAIVKELARESRAVPLSSRPDATTTPAGFQGMDMLTPPSSVGAIDNARVPGVSTTGISSNRPFTMPNSK